MVIIQVSDSWLELLTEVVSFCSDFQESDRKYLLAGSFISRRVSICQLAFLAVFLNKLEDIVAQRLK